jgi:dienelactone hydrolase
MKHRNRLLALFTLLLTASLSAEVKHEVVDYKQGETALQGHLYYDDKPIAGQRPAVIVVHEWFGLNDYAKRRAQQLAELGYVAFAADIYGKGVMAKNVEEAGKMSGTYKSDRNLMRARIQAALDVVKKNQKVDPKRVGAIGYCFGGTTVLELARSGADLAGVVSFHGGLDTNMPTKETPKAKVLVLHGAVDPFVPPAQVQGFMDEMNSAKVDYQLVAYAGAVHSFTNPDADKLNLPGAKYHEPTDKRSWKQMQSFFDEIFKK